MTGKLITTSRYNDSLVVADNFTPYTLEKGAQVTSHSKGQITEIKLVIYGPIDLLSIGSCHLEANFYHLWIVAQNIKGQK